MNKQEEEGGKGLRTELVERTFGISDSGERSDGDVKNRICIE